MPKILDKLIENPKVLYIYEVGLRIYGLFPDTNDRDFVIIYDDGYVPEFSNIEDNIAFEKEDDYSFQFQIFYIKDWFEKVLNSDLIAWECACLPKKYIYKEYVKLLLQTNPLQLRKEFDAICKYAIPKAENIFKSGYTITGQKILWQLIKHVMFANQIIENHKILNFKEPQNAYREIVNGQCTDWNTTFSIFHQYLVKHRDRLKEYTDGALMMSKLKKINQDV